MMNIDWNEEDLDGLLEDLWNKKRRLAIIVDMKERYYGHNIRHKLYFSGAFFWWDYNNYICLN